MLILLVLVLCIQIFVCVADMCWFCRCECRILYADAVGSVAAENVAAPANAVAVGAGAMCINVACVAAGLCCCCSC